MKSKKTTKGDLEKKVAIFFEIGLVFTLAIVYFAFNAKSYQKQSMEMLQQRAQQTIQESVPVTEQPNVKPPPPPQLSQIKIVSNNTSVSPDIHIDVSANPNTPVSDYTPSTEEPEVPEKVPFTIVEHMPRFPGGETALMKYLSAHIQYPELAQESNIQGTVFIKFVVERDGSIDRVKVLRGIGGGCNMEAIRVVKNMPRWIPGKQRGRPVAVYFTLPVKFKLQ